MNSVTKSWDPGPAPKIDVDLYAGYISVVQSTDGRLSAVITTSAGYVAFVVMWRRASFFKKFRLLTSIDAT
jgi:hypothetical protein